MKFTSLTVDALSRMDEVVRHGTLVDAAVALADQEDLASALVLLPVDVRLRLILAASDELEMRVGRARTREDFDLEVFLRTYAARMETLTEDEMLALASVGSSGVHEQLLKRGDLTERAFVGVITDELPQAIDRHLRIDRGWRVWVWMADEGFRMVPRWMLRSLVEDVVPLVAQAGGEEVATYLLSLHDRSPLPVPVLAQLEAREDLFPLIDRLVLDAVEGIDVSDEFRARAEQEFPDLTGLPDDMFLDMLTTQEPCAKDWPAVPDQYQERWGEMLADVARATRDEVF